MRPTTVVAIGLLLLPFAYAGVGFATQFRRQAAFDKTEIGDSYEDVLRRFGTPSAVDGADKAFTRYADRPCPAPCVKRIWFENRLFLDIEAWSVSFDANGRVVQATHWVSP